MASTTRNSKTTLKIGKKFITIDPDGDYDVNWQRKLWREVWSNAYIPENLRGKIKVVFDEKDGRPIIKAIK